MKHLLAPAGETAPRFTAKEPKAQGDAVSKPTLTRRPRVRDSRLALPAHVPQLRMRAPTWHPNPQSSRVCLSGLNRETRYPGVMAAAQSTQRPWGMGPHQVGGASGKASGGSDVTAHPAGDRS